MRESAVALQAVVQLLTNLLEMEGKCVLVSLGFLELLECVIDSIGAKIALHFEMLGFPFLVDGGLLRIVVLFDESVAGKHGFLGCSGVDGLVCHSVADGQELRIAQGVLQLTEAACCVSGTFEDMRKTEAQGRRDESPRRRQDC